MIKRMLIAGLSVASSALAALAQDAPRSATWTGALPFALGSSKLISLRVDDVGRVVSAVASPDKSVQTIGDSAPPGSANESCAAASEISVEDAKALVRKIATEENFMPEFVMAVAKAESRFRSTATSPRGAYGLMQLMPALASDLKVNRCLPPENVRGGVRHLRALWEKYANPMIVLAAYNAGERATTEAGGVPLYRETVDYITDILGDFYQWRPVAPQVRSAAKAPRIVARSQSRAAVPPSKRRIAGNLDAEGWKSGFVLNLE